MEKERKIKGISLCALLVAVLGLTVAFASLSQTLVINGSATVNAASWDIHFENLKLSEKTGTASINGTPTLSGTSISGIDVSVMKPGDKIVYTFDIVNNGTIDAVLEKTSNSAACYICTLIATNLNDKPDLLVYDFDGSGTITVNDVRIYQQMINSGIFYEDGGATISEGDIINAGETKHMNLIVEFKESATRLPGGQIKIFDAIKSPFTFEYLQKD